MRKIRGHKQINTPTWWDNYYNSEIYDGFTRINEPRKSWILKEIRTYQEEKAKLVSILDIGCGWGELFSYLTQSGIPFKGLGMDICPRTIEYASNLLGMEHYILASADKKFPFANNSFDVVFCGETLEHLSYPKQALREIKRVTKTGGLIVITVPWGLLNNAHEHMYQFQSGDLSQELGLPPRSDTILVGREMVTSFVKEIHD